MHARKMNDIGNAHTANGDIRKTWKKQNVATMDAQRETEPEKKNEKNPRLEYEHDNTISQSDHIHFRCKCLWHWDCFFIYHL